jgi:hypothetical protein
MPDTAVGAHSAADPTVAASSRSGMFGGEKNGTGPPSCIICVAKACTQGARAGG